MPTITALDKNTIRSIHTGQVIISTESIVKELLENSLDAKANAIEVRLVDDGLQKIEVRDNGDGIALHNRCNMARQHYTSKLSTFADLERVETYGFRGEALSALCEISGEVFITTKTKQDVVATCYKLDRNGNILSENASGSISQTGTVISVYQPFAHLPVRRQVAEKTKVNSLKRIHDLMIKYGLSHPFARLSLNQQQNTLGKAKTQSVWIKPSTDSLTEGVRILYSAALASMVEECSFEETFDQQVDLSAKSTPSPIKLHCLLPSRYSDPSQIFKGERVFIYVDKRPINYAKSDLKELVSMVRQRYKKALGLEDDSKKIPFMYIDIQSSFGGYDVNIEPDKSVVMFVGKDRLMNVMQELLDQIYGSFFNNNSLPSTVEDHSSINNHTIQEVPCHSPELASTNSHESLHLQPFEAISGVHNDSHIQYGLDAMGNDLYEPATPRPPLLNDWLKQHSLTDDTHKRQTDASQSSRMPMGISNTQNQLPAATKSATSDWQIDKELDTVTTPTSSPASSPTQIQHVSRHSDDDHAAQLSNWFNQFRRPSNSNNTITKRRSTDSHHLSSIPSQTKRPRLQLSLPFNQTHSASTVSPILWNTDSSVPVTSVQQPPDITTASLSPPSTAITSPDTDLHSTNNAILRPTIPSMIPLSSTQHHDIVDEQPSQARSILTNSSATRRRDITALFNKLPESSYTQEKEPIIKLTSTINETTTLESPETMADLATSYKLYRQRYAQLHRKPVEEYHQQVVSFQSTMKKEQQKQSSWNSFLFENKTNHGMVIFTKGAYTDIGWLENCVAVMNISILQQRYKFQMLMDEYELKCGKPLTVPVQIKISGGSPLYGTIISLDKKEECVADDDHGFTEQTYSSIIDKRITANGFRVRWRKEPYAQELVVQFTAISDISGYGPADFNQILEHINRSIQQQKKQPLVVRNDDTVRKSVAPLKKIRPTKVVDYFASMVKDMPGSTLTKSSESDWECMLASLDEETQYHFTNGKVNQPSPVHYLV
ncbi:hypothetical protein BCR42DRAFT_423934 [Absidia repens]|uniref:DNA mismatch repair protein S5 domain-containing protein n=1 Tax=Absidia repens TaxID=90262 RepID=A0A1X2I4H5_9FUNG|nr:hypothetical protein BCR42DRAFT_423934 [Absidia repens]